MKIAIASTDHNQPFSKIMIMAGIAYPIWGLISTIASPNGYDDLLGRSLVGASSVLVGLFHKKLNTKMVLAVHIQATLFMIHFYTMVARSGAEERLLFGSVIFSIALFTVFMNYPRSYLAHISIVTTTLLGLTWYYGVFGKAFQFTRQIGLMYIIMYFITRVFTSHTKVIDSLQEEKFKLIEDQKNTVVNNLKSAQSIFTSLGANAGEVPSYLQLKFYYRPAAEAGGDWLSHYYSKERNWLIVTIGDVTGHDLGSSLVTIAVAGAARGTYESLISQSESLGQMLEKIATSSNTAVKFCGIEGKCMSAVFMGIDLNTQKGYFVNCAHPPALSKSASSTKFLSVGATALLGQMSEPMKPVEFDMKEIKTMVLYTDGLVENPSKTINDGRFLRMVNKSKDIYTELSEFAVQLPDDDDIAFCVIEVKDLVTHPTLQKAI